MLANKKRINSVVQGPSLSRDECTVCIHPGRCRPSEETAHGRRSEGAPAGYANRNCCTLCTFAVGPEQNLVRLSRQGVPHSPVQKFPVGAATYSPRNRGLFPSRVRGNLRVLRKISERLKSNLRRAICVRSRVPSRRP